MTPETCALEGLSVLARGKAAHVPGARTRLLLQLLPRSLITRVLDRMTAAFAHPPPLGLHEPPQVRRFSNTDAAAAAPVG